MSFEFRKDSSLFIAKPLESFSKTFNLNDCKKGWFPHDFNRKSNFHYVGKFPGKEYFKSEFFNITKKEEFNIWYDTVKDQVFDFERQLRDYCWSDVELLSQGCLEFSKIMKEISKLDENDKGIDPLIENITLSSFVNKFYRRNFMPYNSIPWIPSYGYNPKEITSRKAETWLKFLAEKNKIYIQHSKNGGEKRVGKYLLDGFSEKNKKICELDGCLWHGCERCFGHNSFNPVLQCMNSTLRERRNKKIKYLNSKFPDYEIITLYPKGQGKYITENFDYSEKYLGIIKARL
jgi:hypothetical protein